VRACDSHRRYPSLIEEGYPAIHGICHHQPVPDSNCEDKERISAGFFKTLPLEFTALFTESQPPDLMLICLRHEAEHPDVGKIVGMPMTDDLKRHCQTGIVRVID
jgi:hypothetical protein